VSGYKQIKKKECLNILMYHKEYELPPEPTPPPPGEGGITPKGY